MVTRLAQGAVTANQRGAYDLRAGRAEIEQTLLADSHDVAIALGMDDGLDLTTRTVLTKDAAYLQMPAWPAAIRHRWLRYTGADLAGLGAGDVDLSDLLPPLVGILSEARPGPPRVGVHTTAQVLVTSADAIAAFPNAAASKLIAKGINPEELTGDLVCEVGLDAAGHIASVRVDADTAFDQAYELAGLGHLGSLITATEADITLTGHGVPVVVKVPSGRDVMTQQEFEDAAPPN